MANKVGEWVMATEVLSKTLPEDDGVLNSLKERISDRLATIPLLEKLTSKSVKVCTVNV